MSRRRESRLEEMLGRFIELPFWMSIVGAVFFFVTLHFVPPLLAGPSMTAKILATAIPGTAPYAAAVVIVAGLIGVAKRRWRALLLSRVGGSKGLADLDWRDFEHVVGESYRRQGYTVAERGGHQPDGAVDLELRRNSEKVIVQCKHWVNRQVPVQRVRELLGVIVAEGADRGIFVATSGFTQDARAFAAGQPIDLIDGPGFAEMARAIKRQAQVRPENQVEVSDQQPGCPQCGKPMVRRTAKRGANASSVFWGCRSYPACRGTRAA